MAIYLKHTIPDMVEQIDEIYKAKSTPGNFQIPELIKNNCIKHIHNLKKHVSNEDLKNMINESIKVDGEISIQEVIMKDFIFSEIDKP
jgi:hypothetical protein